jgi:hemerythrin-like metal-binding protein/PAS domain S-box-containing protein
MAVRKGSSISRSRPDIFVWSGKYRVGIAKVDQQHKKLVTLINALARQLAEEAPPDGLARVLEELASYTNYHFKTEETLMREYQVDGEFQAGHRQAHAVFVQEVARATELARRNPQQITTKTLTFLSRWLIQHILGTDMRMANEIIALEKGLTAEEARKRANAKAADSQDVLLGAMGELYESLAARTQELLLTNQRLKEEVAFHRSAEDRLRTLSAAVEHSPVSTFITDPDGFFEYVNRRFTELTGYGADEVAGQTPRLLRSEETAAETVDALWTSIAAGIPWSGELRNRRKNGELYWDRLSVTPIFDDAGKVAHYLALQEDVTGQKLAREDLNQSHAQLLADLRRQSGDLARLNQASELLRNCLTPEECYRGFAYGAELLSLGVGGALALADAAGAAWITVARWGEAEAMADRFAAEDCWALRRGQAHPVAEAARGLLCRHYGAAPARPHFCLPLLRRGQACCLVHVELADGDEASRSHQLQLATALAGAFLAAWDSLSR